MAPSGLYQSLGWRVKTIKEDAERLAHIRTNVAEYRRIHARIIERLYEINVLCKTFGLDPVAYCAEHDIELNPKPNGHIGVTITG